MFTSSECIDYFGSTTVAQNTCFVFFAKWEVALSWKSSGVDMEVSQPYLVYYSHIAPPQITSGYREKRKPEQTRINTGSIQLGEKKESWKGFEGNATQQMVITWTLKHPHLQKVCVKDKKKKKGAKKPYKKRKKNPQNSRGLRVQI